LAADFIASVDARACCEGCADAAAAPSIHVAPRGPQAAEKTTEARDAPR